jgi:hypothetical protein
MPYHLYQSDKPFENAKQNSVQKWKIREIVVYHNLKLLLNHLEFRKILKMNKFRNFLTNPTVYHMHHSDERYENRDKNTVRKYKWT